MAKHLLHQTDLTRLTIEVRGEGYGPCWTTFELPPLSFKPWTQKSSLRLSSLERA
jgi:hypothetical protein